MRTMRAVAMALLAVAVAVPAVWAGPKSRRVKHYRAGEVFCVSHALVATGSGVVIRERCYVVGIVRNSRGTFLAFLDPGVRIPPGQVVRLSTPAGAKLRGRIFYLVPLQAVVAAPVDTLVVVPMQVEDEGSRLTVILSGPSRPNLTEVFSVRL